MIRNRSLDVVMGVGLELMDIAEEATEEEAPPPWGEGWTGAFITDDPLLLLPTPPPPSENLRCDEGIIMVEAAPEELAMVAAIVHR